MQRCFREVGTVLKDNCPFFELIHIFLISAFQDNSYSTIVIIAILIALIAVFSLIVYFANKFHTQKIKQTLQTTKNELEANVLKKQSSIELAGLNSMYEELNEEGYYYSSPMYECDENGKEFEMPSHHSNTHEPEYLTMKDTNVKNSINKNVYVNVT